MVGYKCDNNVFFFLKDAEGDVIGLVNSSNGNVVEKYSYDPWGAVTGANANSQRYNSIYYRGYYYDIDDSRYYLQSRYYKHQWGSFINADLPEIAQQSKNEVNGLNLFTYCCNDPVNNVDPSGFKINLNNPPSPSTGYKAPKGGPKKVRVPKGSYKNRWGWIDKSGKYWVPDNKNPHGGDHWDVVSKDGKSHTNVYPDGYERGKNSKIRFPAKTIRGIINILVPSENLTQAISNIIPLIIVLSSEVLVTIILLLIIPEVIPAL